MKQWYETFVPQAPPLDCMTHGMKHPHVEIYAPRQDHLIHVDPVEFNRIQGVLPAVRRQLDFVRPLLSFHDT